jgi:hypothetical protein
MDWDRRALDVVRRVGICLRQYSCCWIGQFSVSSSTVVTRGEFPDVKEKTVTRDSSKVDIFQNLRAIRRAFQAHHMKTMHAGESLKMTRTCDA